MRPTFAIATVSLRNYLGKLLNGRLTKLSRICWPQQSNYWWPEIESNWPLVHSRAQKAGKQESLDARNCGRAKAHVKNEFLACPLIPESRSCSRSVAVMFYYTCRWSYALSWSVDCNGKIWPVSVIVLVPILSRLDSDTFTLVSEKVPNFQDHFPIFLAMFFLNLFILLPLPHLAPFHISSNFYTFYPP